METQTAPVINHLEQQRAANSALLLRESFEEEKSTQARELYEQARLNEATLFSEMLDGVVTRRISFETRDGTLYAPQLLGGTDWATFHRRGVERAEAIATSRPELKEFVRWAKAEQQEGEIQEAMVASGRRMAMVKLSLVGKDLFSDKALKQLGRRPEIERAFLRVSLTDGGELDEDLRSIDSLKVQDGIDGITTGWGMTNWPETKLPSDPTSADIVEATVIFDQNDMSAEDMNALADRLVANFDRIQSERTGKVHHAGRCPEGTDTYKFVLREHPEILDNHMIQLGRLAQRQFSDADLAYWSDYLRYDTNSAYKQLLEGNFVRIGSTTDSVGNAGNIERDKGTEYYGCETSLGANGRNTAGLSAFSNGNTLGFTWIGCKFCGAKQYGDPCSSYFACGKCNSKKIGDKVIKGDKVEGSKTHEQTLSQMIRTALRNYDTESAQRRSAKHQ